jgi:hypothetical protein
MRMIRHLVLLNWRREADPKQVRLFIERLNRLPDECELIYNWCSSQTHTGAGHSRPSTHDFCFSFDFISPEEQTVYSKHPYTVQLHEEAGALVDLEGVASIDMIVEAEPVRKKSCF